MPGHSSLPCADCVNLSAVPGIHVFLRNLTTKTRMAGTKPGHDNSIALYLDLALALPDQDQPKRSQCRAISGPLDLVDHEARLRPGDRAGALADPEQADGERQKADDQEQLAHRFS